MSRKSTTGYEAPEVTEYGAVESITEQSNKIGPDDDEFSDVAPIVGSLTPVQ